MIKRTICFTSYSSTQHAECIHACVVDYTPFIVYFLQHKLIIIIRILTYISYTQK